MNKYIIYKITADGHKQYFDNKYESKKAWMDAFLSGAKNITEEELNGHELTAAQINKMYRSMDESNKWPICGRFNVTERAIRRCRDKYHRMGEANPGGMEYLCMLEDTMSKIVNEQV